MEKTVLFHFLDNDILDSLLILIIVLWSNLSHIFHINFKSHVLKFSFNYQCSKTHIRESHRCSLSEPTVISQPWSQHTS